MCAIYLLPLGQITHLAESAFVCTRRWVPVRLDTNIHLKAYQVTHHVFRGSFCNVIVIIILKPLG